MIKRSHYLLLSVLSYLCSGSMLYIHLSELWNRKHGIATFLQTKSAFEEDQAMTYSVGWASLFFVLTLILVWLQIRKKQKRALAVALAILTLTIVSFCMDSFFYFG